MMDKLINNTTNKITNKIANKIANNTTNKIANKITNKLTNKLINNTTNKLINNTTNKLKIKSIWFLQYNNNPIQGPFSNSMTNEGLEKFAAKIAELEAPYIAIGDTNGETFRKAVGAVIQNGALLRFRATLTLSEANGDHTWLALYSNATRNSGSGIKINHLDQLFSKAQNQTLNIECRITFQQGVV